MLVKENGKPITYIKGDEFETFVKNTLFPEDKYKLLQISPSYEINKDRFVESSKDPDFKFRDKLSGIEFFVEAKYRSSFYRGAITWCKRYQLERYQEIDSRVPVYVVLGIQGLPSTPQHVFMFRVKDVKYIKLYLSVLKPYEISHSQCMDIKTIP